MLRIETRGSWFDMGRQLGVRYASELRRCMERFLSFLPAGAELDNATAVERSMVREHCPELLEETAGMAAGAEVPEQRLFRYRFFVDIRRMADTGCSAFFVLDDSGRPWLGRTCDIEREDHWNQILHVRRPANGTATATTTYLGMAVSVGMNEYGVGIVGVSSPERQTYGAQGIPYSLLGHRALHSCRHAGEVHRLLMEQPVLGQGCNIIVADPEGQSTLYEMASGRHMVALPRPSGSTWQACTNFHLCPDIPNADMPDYLYNAYARYGRLVHRLGGNHVERTAQGLQRLLADVSQPGPYIPKGASSLETAYATLFDLKNRIVYLAPANPNASSFESFSL